MINKFEAVGIFISVACMVIALFFLRVEDTPGRIDDARSTQGAAVIVAGSDVAGPTVAEALRESIDTNGMLGKLVIDDVVLGYGDPVEAGDTVTVHYIGTLTNGQQFDNSNKKGTPFTFTVGEGRVIEGWEMGLLGMQVGGERILVIPANLAYGSKQVGPIPPNSPLMFSIELLSIDTDE